MQDLLNLINLVPPGIQFALAVISLMVVLSAHIAPHTSNKYDDKIADLVAEHGLEGFFKGILTKILNSFAGNYRKAKNK